MKPGHDYTIQSVVKALDVLFAFREAPHAFTLAQLVKRLPFSKNQVYRCVRTLETYGLLRQDEEARYVLSTAIYSLAEAVHDEASLIRIAQPSLDRLARITGESVHLVGYVDGGAVVLDRRDSPAGLRVSTRIGARTTLHAGAVPKAILAFLPPVEQETILAQLPHLPRFTPNTTTDPAQLANELEAIRARGYSISDQDYELGARGVGAPIFGHNQQVVGGISVGGPIGRIGVEKLRELGEMVAGEAKVISRQLTQISF
ncbi:MAG: IclR family transcriptional regulator [Bacillota bacterium]|nr:IclR family transcriptional regulator [Bacillota bacterium]